MARKSARKQPAKKANPRKANTVPVNETTQEALSPPVIDAPDGQSTDTVNTETKPDAEMTDAPDAEPTTERPTTAASDNSGAGSEFKVPAQRGGSLIVNTKLPISSQSSLQSSPLSEPPSGSLSQVASASEGENVGLQRSSRKRRAPQRFTEEPASPTPNKSAKEPAAPRKQSKPTPKRSISDKWTEKALFEGTNSALATVDLVKLLNEPRTWDLLSAEEKQILAAAFPANALDGPLDNPATRFRQGFLKYDNDWKSGIRMYQEDLANGRYDPEWIRQAGKATADRANGAFDTWKEKEFEEFWGQKQKLAQNVIAGESNKVKLDTLVRNAVFHVGDIWVFSRAFADTKGKKGGVLVEKEATLTSIESGAKLTFTYPPKQHKLSSPHLRSDIEIKGVTGPSHLENAIIKEDGRITSPPNGNAWKVFRCKRKNQDLGALWDMRQFYYIHKHKR
ncbi:hypothetical protein FGG08_003195 [Glutinoglossum americanum]|uniref:DEUBAD domain-containing protein n=1 Tax=Glutinoglossum americanum TaxID=1670608 RepID=A0A9P8I7S8_9PEZI|nr:hypothetical protein FGG08_003195 [Glutinoglossum americanum]